MNKQDKKQRTISTIASMKTRASRVGLLSIISNSLIGVDIFISYRRREARDYALALRRELEAKNYRCFLDEALLHTGMEIERYKKEARKSRMFVLVGSASIFESEHVPQELQAYVSGHQGLLSKRWKRIFPINIAGALDTVESSLSREALAGTLWEPLGGLVCEAETSLALDSGTPSSSVIDRIDQSFSLIRSVVMLLLGTFLLAVAIIAATTLAVQLSVSAANRKLSELAEKFESKNQELNGVRTELSESQDKLSHINEELEAAQLKLSGAQQETIKAKAETDMAKAETVKEKGRTIIARKNADALGLVTQSEKAFNLGPKYLSRSLSFGIDSMKTLPTVDGERAIRRVMSLTPPPNNHFPAPAISILANMLSEAVDPGIRAVAQPLVQAVPVAYSPDSRLLATSEMLLNPASFLDSQITVRDAKTGAIRWQEKSDGSISQFAFGPDSLTLALKVTAGSNSLDSIQVVKLAQCAGEKLSEKERKTFKLKKREMIKKYYLSTTARYVASMVSFTPEVNLIEWSNNNYKSPPSNYYIRLWDTHGKDSDPPLLNEEIRREVCIAFNPDDSLMAVASLDGNIILFDPKTGKRMPLQMEAAGTDIVQIKFSHTGSFLVGTGSTNLFAWDVKTGKRIIKLDYGYGLGLLVFHPKKDRFLISRQNKIELFDLDLKGNMEEFFSKTIVMEHDNKSLILDAVFSPDGDMIATGGDDGTLRVWRARDGRNLALAGHDESFVVAVAFAEDLRSIFSFGWRGASEFGAACVWDFANSLYSEFSVPDQDGKLKGAAISQDGSRLAVWREYDGYKHKVTVYDVASGELLGTENLEGDTRNVTPLLAFSPDGKYLVAANDDGIQPWEVKGIGRITRLKRLELPAMKGALGRGLICDAQRVGFVYRTGFLSPDADDEGEIGIWENWRTDNMTLSKAGKEKIRIPDVSPIFSSPLGNLNLAAVAFSNNGKYMATVIKPSEKDAKQGTQCLIKITPFDGGKALILPQKSSVTTLTFSPDGDMLIVGADDGTVTTWTWAGGAPRGEQLGHHTNSIRFVGISSDRQYVASVGLDDNLKVWRIHGWGKSSESGEKMVMEIPLRRFGASWGERMTSLPFTFSDSEKKWRLVDIKENSVYVESWLFSPAAHLLDDAKRLIFNPATARHSSK